uniref:Uncharacterized protein n=1 Tax=viral metagenome TaxID=1070528 RepID=A0A6M3LC85_9ZZZZ
MGKTYRKMYENASKSKAVKQLTPTYHEWKKENDQVIGAFVTKTEVQSRLGGAAYNQYLFDTDEGLIKFALGRMADSELSDQFVRGNIYSITYNGKEKIAGGRSVNRFSVEEIGIVDDLESEAEAPEAEAVKKPR